MWWFSSLLWIRHLAWMNCVSSPIPFCAVHGHKKGSCYRGGCFIWEPQQPVCLLRITWLCCCLQIKGIYRYWRASHPSVDFDVVKKERGWEEKFMITNLFMFCLCDMDMKWNTKILGSNLFRIVARFTVRDKMRISIIWTNVTVELLLISIRGLNWGGSGLTERTSWTVPGKLDDGWMDGFVEEYDTEIYLP